MQALFGRSLKNWRGAATNKALHNRLKAIESRQKPNEKTFFQRCIEWRDHPENRSALAVEAEMSEAAAGLMFGTGLKYGAPMDDTRPFEQWETEDLYALVRLIDNPA